MDGLRKKMIVRRGAGRPSGTRLPAAAGKAEPRNAEFPMPTKAQLAGLANAIEAQIVPRLVLAHGTPASLSEDGGTWKPTAEQIADFAQVVLDKDADRAFTHIEALRSQGVPLEALFLELLAPAARYLGELWNEDICDFTAVTVGLWRLQQVVRTLSPTFEREGVERDQGRRALLLPVPGEQHSFGLGMVIEFFRRAGWDVWAGTPSGLDELVQIVRSEWFAVVGFSIGCEAHLPGLAATIHTLRRISRNRSVGIMVGGAVFLEHPEYVALVGADASALDGKHAISQAESLLGLMTRRA